MNPFLPHCSPGDIDLNVSLVMRSLPISTMSTKRKSKDAWSPILVATSAVGTICADVLFLSSSTGPSALSILVFPAVLLIIILFIFINVIYIFYDILTRRFRHALSIAAAAAVTLGIVYCTPLIAQTMDKLAFQRRLPKFEQQVEEARAKQPTQEPLQIIVEVQDRSVIATSNSFYYLIYDETDRKAFHKSMRRVNPGSLPDLFFVCSPTEIRHLTGHFYDFHCSY